MYKMLIPAVALAVLVAAPVQAQGLGGGSSCTGFAPAVCPQTVTALADSNVSTTVRYLSTPAHRTEHGVAQARTLVQITASDPRCDVCHDGEGEGERGSSREASEGGGRGVSSSGLTGSESCEPSFQITYDLGAAAYDKILYGRWDLTAPFIKSYNAVYGPLGQCLSSELGAANAAADLTGGDTSSAWAAYLRLNWYSIFVGICSGSQVTEGNPAAAPKIAAAMRQLAPILLKNQTPAVPVGGPCGGCILDFILPDGTR